MDRLHEQYLIISPGRFHYLKFILEGYDNMALLSSYRMEKGVVVLRFPKEQAGELYALLGSIATLLIDKHYGASHSKK